MRGLSRIITIVLTSLRPIKIAEPLGRAVLERIGRTRLIRY